MCIYVLSFAQDIYRYMYMHICIYMHICVCVYIYKENDLHTVAFRSLPSVPSVASPFGRSSVLFNLRARA